MFIYEYFIVEGRSWAFESVHSTLGLRFDRRTQVEDTQYVFEVCR